MSQPKDKDPLGKLLDGYLADLMDMSAEDVLAGEDPKAVKASGLKMLDAAKAEAGRRKLAIARAQMAARASSTGTTDTGSVSAAEARAFLRAAANDPLFTLAARKLEELTDEEAIRMYLQLQQVKASRSDAEGD